MPPADLGGRVFAPPQARRLQRFGPATRWSWPAGSGRRLRRPGTAAATRLYLPARPASGGDRWVERDLATRRSPAVPRGDDWLEVPGTLPRVRLVTQPSPATTRPATSAASTSARRPLPNIPWRCRRARPATSALVTERPGRMEVAVMSRRGNCWSCPRVITPAGRPSLAAAPQPVLRVNGDFLGCLVGPGEQIGARWSSTRRACAAAGSPRPPDWDWPCSSWLRAGRFPRRPPEDDTHEHDLLPSGSCPKACSSAWCCRCTTKPECCRIAAARDRDALAAARRTTRSSSSTTAPATRVRACSTAWPRPTAACASSTSRGTSATRRPCRPAWPTAAATPSCSWIPTCRTRRRPSRGSSPSGGRATTWSTPSAPSARKTC